ncbi:hypothetical protein CaCOL14_011023 [Colletotrichum acutatum]
MIISLTTFTRRDPSSESDALFSPRKYDRSHAVKTAGGVEAIT